MNCLKYGHVSKYCKPNAPQRCQSCAGEHDKKKFTARQPSCYHCLCLHKAGDSVCQRHLDQKEIAPPKMVCIRRIEFLKGVCHVAIDPARANIWTFPCALVPRTRVVEGRRSRKNRSCGGDVEKCYVTPACRRRRLIGAERGCSVSRPL